MATSNRAQPTGQCPECHAPTADHGIERVCESCGLVVATDALDRGPDWRSFPGDDTNPERAYPGNPNRHDRGLGSEMGHASERDRDDHRRARWHAHAKADGKRDRTRNYATAEVERVRAALSLPRSYGEQATALFRQLQDSGETVGHDLDTVAATAVYTVCRVHQRGVTPDDVAAVARGADANSIARRHTWLSDTLGVPVPPPDVRQRVRVVARELGLGEWEREQAMDVVDGLDELERSNGSPSVLAAVACWVGVESVTQVAAGEAAGVSATAIRKRWGNVG